MKILFLVHDFLPAVTGGTEVAVLHLAQGLTRCGHAVHVLHGVVDYFLADGAVRERVVEGVTVTAVNTHRAEPGRDGLFSHRVFAETAQKLVARFGPDVIHAHHVLYGCAEALGRMQALGFATVFTLHDYYAVCPRAGQMLRADGARCDVAIDATCAACVPDFAMLRGSPLDALLRNIYRVPAPAQRALKQVVKASSGRIERATERVLKLTTAKRGVREPGTETESTNADAIAARKAELLALLHGCDAIVSPSADLRARVERNGLRHPNAHVIDNGLNLPPALATRDTHRPVRFGFVGNPSEAKGLRLLIDASRTLAASGETRFSVELFALESFARQLCAELRAKSPPMVRWNKAVSRGQLAQAFASFDVLVLPSRWWENAPLVLREASHFKTPVLVAKIGGMSEWVEGGERGFVFEVAGTGGDDAGDALALALAMRGLIEEPRRVNEMRMKLLEPMTAETGAQAHLALYSSVIDERRARNAR